MNSKFEKKELKKKSENLSAWYTDVILKAELADYAPVKGMMVIRPYGYAIWEKVQQAFNFMMRLAHVQNAYFPLFIPHSLLEKEKEHVKGFSPELAVVTIGGGERLKDPLVVRPTSETIMYEMYKKWIHSWRDLPLLINQWNNVVRWEKRTYLFLRTTEFLWQEGHTAHTTEKEAIDMATKALHWYKELYEDYYAIPVVLGTKSASEKFAGAKTTYTVELLMPDGKALQGSTSHNLGQNFSKPFDIKFQTKDGKTDYVWQTSWGISTRSLGALVLTHGDDNGLVLPPRLAPYQVVIIPIKTPLEGKLYSYIVTDILENLSSHGIEVMLDDREGQSFGRRINDAELKGIPLRYEIGEREMNDNTVTLVRRDNGEKITLKNDGFLLAKTNEILADIHKSMLSKAKKFLAENTREASDYEEFKKIMTTTRGFIRAFWCEDADCEAAIKEETKASTRALPLDAPKETGICIHCGKPATHRWLFAQAY